MSNNLKTPKESRYWHFRVNDLSEEQFEHLKNIECEYLNIGAIEPNKVRQGSHYHTIVIFSRSQRYNYAKKHLLYNQDLIETDWYLGAKYINSTVDQFVNYAIKQGTRFTKGSYTIKGNGATSMKHYEDEEEKKDEFNQLNIEQVTKKEEEEQRKKDLNLMRIEKARKLDYDWFLQNDMHYFNTSNCKSLFANVQHRNDLENLSTLDNYYIYGEPGTGKSSAIEFIYPNCYRKLKTNEKWDSYSNYLPEHETVYFDELDTTDLYERCMGGLEEFKTMTDVYPFPVRSNYGSSQIMVRPKRFIITSNFTPSQVFCTDNKFGKKLQHVEMILKAFNRRFQIMHISEFQKLKGIYFNKEKKRTMYLPEELPIKLTKIEPVQVSRSLSPIRVQTKHKPRYQRVNINDDIATIYNKYKK
jgi:hypothetical protein